MPIRSSAIWLLNFKLNPPAPRPAQPRTFDANAIGSVVQSGSPSFPQQLRLFQLPCLQTEFRANNLFHQLTMRAGYPQQDPHNVSEIFGTFGGTLPIAEPRNTGSGEYSFSGLTSLTLSL
jgi:hypothetical protein